MNAKFPQYTTDYISGVMSLRKPQDTSLKILEEVMTSLNVHKGMNLKAALATVHALYPICSDFERDFMSLTFALATGVGKTRLMGAFIAYLYTQHNVKNYFVVAPNTTIYEKLKHDLSDTGSSKYVFKGLGCFRAAPAIVSGDDYQSRQLSLFASDIRIYIFNIDKFNKEESNMKKVNEFIGNSFYDYLASLPDLVIIMDESHHYRAKRGMKAINELNPLLGLELTATPLVTKGSKQIPFKNVVYEYPLSKAIEDGYTRTPFAGTRMDINVHNLTPQELDKMMILDGITLHERAKRELKAYALNNGTPEHPVRMVKPFMMVVCKDTDHAQWVENYIKSGECVGGRYKNKTIVIHSKQTGAESEENTKLLLDVERCENPVEIVIHVNMLKEGWDVNNLYTIVPLRTAASKVLREQMVGRGLRLPYGKRTGNAIVDAVYLTAHDKFQELLAEAQKGDSIFKAGNVIKVDEIKEHEYIPALTLDLDFNEVRSKAHELGICNDEKSKATLDAVISITQDNTGKELASNGSANLTSVQKEHVYQATFGTIMKERELAAAYENNKQAIELVVKDTVEASQKAAQDKYIPIPQIRIVDQGPISYGFTSFTLDLGAFNHVPVPNNLLIQNLEDESELAEHIDGDAIDFTGYNPKKTILDMLRIKPEIDYETCSTLLFKLITEVTDHYSSKYGYEGMCNIVMLNKQDIANKIYQQMTQDDHFYCENSSIRYEIKGTSDHNLAPNYTSQTEISLYDDPDVKIDQVLFNGIKKAVFSSAKFDSRPELVLARVLEKDPHVLKWLRPAQKEFNITYNRGRHYVPDFVVETEQYFDIVEVKGEDKITNADVIAKGKRAVQFCNVASKWASDHNTKEWRYVFIPSKEIQIASSYNTLAERFVIKDM